VTVRILGLGCSVPKMTISRAESLHVANILCGPYLTDTDWLPAVYENCGVSQRHQVLGRGLVEDLMNNTRLSGSPFLPGRAGGPTTAERMELYSCEAAPLAIEAAEEALTTSSQNPAAITHLVTVSCTGFQAPGIDFSLIEGLRLSRDVQRTHVGFMGCHGAVNGLRVASAIVRAEPTAVVLLVCVELCSIHYYYGAEPGKVIANALFADGAAAIVLASTGTGPSVQATGSHLFPDSQREMGWIIGDSGFAMTLTKQIPKLIARNLREWLASWLAKQNVVISDIAGWGVHPGGPKILDAVRDSLELREQSLAVSRRILHDYGNMSSPTLLFILREMLRAQLSGPTLLIGFGPGLMAEVAIVG
jgi:alpha-pyrone synthase